MTGFIARWGLPLAIIASVAVTRIQGYDVNDFAVPFRFPLGLDFALVLCLIITLGRTMKRS